jgi:hypothetical protein
MFSSVLGVLVDNIQECGAYILVENVVSENNTKQYKK